MYSRFKEQEKKEHLRLFIQFFRFSQALIIQTSKGPQPFKHLRLLVGICINSVSVVHRQHTYILA